jgi:hypothetical protein
MKCGSCALVAQLVLCSALGAQAPPVIPPERIIENTLDDVPMWTARQILQIGAADAPGPTQFFRITDVKFIDAETIAVANAGSGEIRIFDVAGRHVRTLGGPGRGPGEFTWLGHIHPMGTELLAVDFGPRQVTRLALTGGVISTNRLAGGPDVRWPTPIGVLGNGDIIAVNGQSFERGESGFGLVRPPFEILSFRSESAAPTLLVTFPGTEFWVTGERELITTKTPFGPETLHAVSGTRFWLASSHRFEVYGFGSSGTPELMIRATVPDRGLTGAQVDRRIRDRLAVLPEGEMRERTMRSFRAMPEPQSAPLIDQIAGSPEGGVWVRGAATAPARTWHIFDASGRIRASIVLPATFTIRAIRDDRVVGVWTDEDGVEHVRIYAVER